MKEVTQFEQWADKIIANEDIQDRPLARSQDIQYQASREYPDRSPEQALQLYVSKKLADNEKTDVDQTKSINSQKRENEQLRRTVRDLEQELNFYEREVDRIKSLTAKLQSMTGQK